MAIKKILLIRFRRVGDAVLSVSLCTSLKKSFPEAEIHYVLNENIAPLFFGHPDIDKVITFSDYDMASTMRYVRKVRSVMKEGKYDMIVDTRATVKTSVFSLFSLRTPYRIGRKKVYTPLIHNYRIDNYPDGTRDNVTLALELLNALDKRFDIVKDADFKLYVSEENRRAYQEYLISKGLDLTKPVIICAVTARIESKVWSKEKMRQVLQHVLDKYEDAQLVFNYGGEREKAAAVSIYEAMGKPSRVFIDVEAKNLIELKSLMSFSSLFFGNEGGPRHIAQALGIPAYAIYPPNVKKAEWLPNPGPVNQGIGLCDIDPVAASDEKLTFEQKLDLIDVASVWTGLDNMLTRLGFNRNKDSVQERT